MLPRRPPARLALASILLTAACDGEAKDSDTTAATETDSETDTDSEGGGECVFDDSDPKGDAQSQPMVLTNSGPAPLFVMPPGCAHLPVSVDGVEYRLGTRHACSGALPCYDGCDGDLLTPPIRVDPGGTFDWPFEGYVWRTASIPGSCRPTCEEPDFGSCGIGQVVDEGALVEISIYVTAVCNLDQCECPMGETSCLLDDTVTEGGSPGGPRTAVAVSFTHGSADPVMIDLAN